MPSLSDHQSNRSTKLLLLGDSGTGKTGALASLVAAGYTLCILDYDNGLDSLKSWAKHDNSDLSLVEYETLRDRIKGQSTDRPLYEGTPDAFTKGIKLLDRWSDGTVPSQWDDKTILVLDSLTHFGNAAYAWARAMNPSSREPRQWFYSAQQAVEAAVARLTSEAFAPSVIITAHINYVDLDEGTKRGFPTAVGQALGVKLVSYFNNVAQVSLTGSGTTAKREIVTVPTTFLSLKNPAPFAMQPRLPIATGLADYFKIVRG